MANSVWSSWAEGLGIFDEVIPFDRLRFYQNLFYRYKTGLHIRRLRCSIAIQPTYSREFWFGDSIMRMCGARERIGSVGENTNLSPEEKTVSDRWYTRLIPADPAPLMELRRNAEFFRGLTWQEFHAKVADLRALQRDERDADFVAKVPEGCPYYVLFPGANWAGRRWPPNSFKDIAERLHRETGWCGVVVWERLGS